MEYQSSNIYGADRTNPSATFVCLKEGNYNSIMGNLPEKD